MVVDHLSHVVIGRNRFIPTVIRYCAVKSYQIRLVCQQKKTKEIRN